MSHAALFDFNRWFRSIEIREDMNHAHRNFGDWHDGNILVRLVKDEGATEHLTQRVSVTL
ncbi:hypothetical protein MnTg02_00082 [bacterium MnTg02]|nr:hypothetical protein MnTg02_00082 [bacterium MnTg02]